MLVANLSPFPHTSQAHKAAEKDETSAKRQAPFRVGERQPTSTSRQFVVVHGSIGAANRRVEEAEAGLIESTKRGSQAKDL